MHSGKHEELNMRARVKRFVFMAPLFLVGLLLFMALGGVVVRSLWNWLLPPLFGWYPITFWQALGLLALCRILFGGLGLHGSSRSRLRQRMAERWEAMTPEERERIRQGMRGRFDFGPSAGQTQEP
jgi:hypothetical protein